MIEIELDRVAINRAIPKVAKGLEKYLWLQAELRHRNVSADREFQRRFNGFYRVRRNSEWQRTFFRMLERGKTSGPTLEKTLRTLHATTGRIEASFASKLVATIDTSQPVIDSVVLAHMHLRLPPAADLSSRVNGIVRLHGGLARAFSRYLRACKEITI